MGTKEVLMEIGMVAIMVDIITFEMLLGFIVHILITICQNLIFVSLQSFPM
jgi:hypothetical protein